MYPAWSFLCNMDAKSTSKCGGNIFLSYTGMAKRMQKATV